MRILLISDCFLPEVNGITYCVVNLATGLQARHTVSVVAPQYELTEPDHFEFPVVRFASKRVPLDAQTQFVLPRMKQFEEFVMQFKPDVLHVHTLGVLGQMGLFWGKKHRVPTVLTYHTLIAGTLAHYPGFSTVPELTEQMLWKFSQWSCNRADCVLAPAQIIADELQRHGVTEKVVMISNGIETSKFKPHKKDSTSFRLLYVGRIAYEKGVRVLVEAVELLLRDFPTLELWLVGDGPAKAELEKEIAQKQLTEHILFKGEIARDQLPAVYTSAAVFVTAAEFEVNPLVVVEALASGLPVIGANKGGMKTGAVKHMHNGMLIDDVDGEHYAAALRTLLSDHALLRHMSEQALTSSKEFDVQVMVERTAQLYQSLSKSKED